MLDGGRAENAASVERDRRHEATPGSLVSVAVTLREMAGTAVQILGSTLMPGASKGGGAQIPPCHSTRSAAGVWRIKHGQERPTKRDLCGPHQFQREQVSPAFAFAAMSPSRLVKPQRLEIMLFCCVPGKLPMPTARTQCPYCLSVRVASLVEVLYSPNADFFQCRSCHELWHTPKGEDAPASRELLGQHRIFPSATLNEQAS